MNKASRLLRAGASAFVLATATFAFTAMPGCSGNPEDAATSPCPPGQTCQVRLTVLHTSDIHSRLLPYDLLITQVDGDLGLGPTGEVHNVGGAARMAYIVKREKARADRVIHLSGGDVFQGAPIFNFFNGEPEMKIQSALEVDAMAIANHEFDKGPLVVYRQIRDWAPFAVLAANYKFEDPSLPTSVPLQTVVKPFSVFNEGGLKIAVIGMGNLSSLTSIFDQPNKLNVTPINTVETAQEYIDLVRPFVDVVFFTTHLGLEVDQRMIRETTGIDVVFGSHNHIVLNPPQTIRDCSADPVNPGFVWALDPNLKVDPNGPAPNDADHPDPTNHPYQYKRPCHPREVLLAHSGAFAKYVGRLDLVFSNTPSEATPDGDPTHYDPVNGFEVVSNNYQAFPINDSVPEDAKTAELLEPYKRQLAVVADLSILAGFSPNGAKRSASQGGDSPLGNLVATASWLRLGVQTDFSLTNTTGIRQDLLPGPVTIEQMYNIFPFDNSISKMQLSGVEVMEMFDFVARRSASRGCASQAQVAGVRVQINCGGCARTAFRQACQTNDECAASGLTGCDQNLKVCTVPACAEDVYIGTTLGADGKAKTCASDTDCPDGDGKPQPGSCAKQPNGVRGVCLSPVQSTNLYELATSNYLAAGGSGFRVLQRNTTQFDTKIQQRDALVDYIRGGHPCGWKKDATTAEGLKACGSDGDCASEGSSFICACTGSETVQSGNTLTCKSSSSCDPSVGRCVRRDCRDQVAAFKAQRCVGSLTPECLTDLGPCDSAGQICQVISCVDDTLGAVTDNRIQMIGR
ncbi:hypothetical protein BH09MYX1_BH09MYX1_31560 [soil metagenome]